MNILIAYFSRAGQNYADGRMVDLKVGNTEAAALQLAEWAGAAVHRIETVQSYPDGYDECTRVARDELRRRARPALVVPAFDLKPFDGIVLGYPNWWGTMPMPVAAFLEGRDWSGKTLLPFCTHEGSGLGSSERDLKALCPGVRLLPGLAVFGSEVSTAGSKLKDWLDQSLHVEG